MTFRREHGWTVGCLIIVEVASPTEISIIFGSLRVLNPWQHSWPRAPRYHPSLLVLRHLSIQILYPVLMFVMIWRTISVRIQPDVLLVFTPVSSEYDDGNQTSLFSRIRESWREDRSLFSWADTGHWRTAPTADGDWKRDGDWFRIGFEPLFVDYNKRGTWFMLVQLLEVRVLYYYHRTSLWPYA